MNAEIEALSKVDLEAAQAAVEGIVREKITAYLLSEGRARNYTLGVPVR